MTCVVSYTSVSRINTAFPAISSVSAITSGVIAQFANDVEARINAKLVQRYSLPLTSDCPILTAIATREAIYAIAVQRALVQFPPAQQGKSPMQVQHAEDLKLLDDIANGRVLLVTTSNQVVTEDATAIEIFSTTQGYVPTFSEGSLYDQIQDPDKLDADLSNRGLR